MGENQSSQVPRPENEGLVPHDYLQFPQGDGFVSKIPEMPLDVVYRQNLELLPLLLKLTKPSRFDRSPSHEEFVFKP
jgi:hypothetical protein